MPLDESHTDSKRCEERVIKILPMQTLFGLEDRYVVDAKLNVHLPLMTGYFSKHSLKL